MRLIGKAGERQTARIYHFKRELIKVKFVMNLTVDEIKKIEKLIGSRMFNGEDCVFALKQIIDIV